MNDAEAMEALRQAIDVDKGVTPQPTPSQPEQAPQTDTSVTEGTTQDKDYDPGLFYGVDPNSLSPDNRRVFDEMQKAFTQKTQEFSEQRKEWESLGDVSQAKQAVEFVQALQDPRNLVQLHGELSEYLQGMGLTKQEADTVAANEIQTQTPQTTPEPWDIDEEPVGRPQPVDESLRRELDELKQFRDRYEQERLQAEIENAIARQETSIRQAHPEYTDENLNDVYQLSYAFGGDLLAAQEAYEEMRQRVASSLIDQKASVPTGVTTTPVAGHAQTPETFGDDLDAAHEYAKRYIAGLAANEGLS